MAYADRTEKLSKLEMARINSKWAARPSGEGAAKKISEERRRLWDALNKYIGAHGGFLVSPPYASPLRLELINNTDAKTDLSGKLTDFGYTLHQVGSVSRVTGSGIAGADVYEFDLPR